MDRLWPIGLMPPDVKTQHHSVVFVKQAREALILVASTSGKALSCNYSRVAKYREEFKLIMDRIAVTKSENGEKFLVLRKKYRQALVERDSRLQETQKTSSPARTPATVQWEAASSPVPAKKQLQDLSLDPTPGDEDGGSDRGVPSGGPEPSEPIECADLPSSQEYESEQDEESLENMGSTSVALDPIEKDWIYSAACARVPDLSQLLQQDPTLANKKRFELMFVVPPLGSQFSHLSPPGQDSTATAIEVQGDGTALHWAAKHGKEDMATLVVSAGADVNTKSGYTPLHIAALHGHRHILELLIQTYGKQEDRAKNNLRDYSGHLASQYLNGRDPEESEEESETQFQATQARERSRNRKLHSLFQSKKKWGSAEELAPIEEERSAPTPLLLPAARPRKFSR
ncbi:Ankyrin repeat domain-containing protein SOWAHC [Merluccius polli]|uniref:Ankyrin repeat domain-containing protein SOWAHC n=1 Tax=Merluccius polli TaxID=89951 RepID=A0AA47NAW6_MERPO|nr:Ankyrin repeat domain-containing protein SOWAHC [Merluccius polli]